MKRLLISFIFALGIVVGVVATGSVRANPQLSEADAARAGLGEAMKHLSQLQADKAGHLRQSLLLTQQAAAELHLYISGLRK
jgi:hypothetical protein